MSTPADRAWMLYRRILPDGREVCVYPLIYDSARLCVGPAEASWMDDVWEYERRGQAIEVARRWSGVGDPEGWSPHPSTGRRRPDGDPA